MGWRDNGTAVAPAPEKAVLPVSGRLFEMAGLPLERLFQRSDKSIGASFPTVRGSVGGAYRL
jgi:hypothetical protein